jgi:hypothetical protein
MPDGGVGLVGATGSYESLGPALDGFPAFPNIHIRSNAFLIQRELFCVISRDAKFGKRSTQCGLRMGKMA